MIIKIKKKKMNTSDTIYNMINSQLKNKVFWSIMETEVHERICTPSNSIVRTINNVMGDMEVIERCIKAELV
jgi:hypothetical protein